MKRLNLPLLLIACLLAVGPPLSVPLSAHDLTLTRTILRLTPDGGWQADVLCDLDALALGVPASGDAMDMVATLHSLPDEEREKVRRRLLDQLARRLRIRFDGVVAKGDITLPDFDDRFTVHLSADGQPTVFGLIVRFSGVVPAGAGELVFSASRAFPPLHLTINDLRFGDVIQHFELLERGAQSAPYPLDAPPAPDPIGETGLRYVALGFEHILPAGLDHILFVLGLFLLAAAWRPLLWQVSAFTAAHTLTLGLAGMDVIRLSPQIVEPLIAISICWIAVENLFLDQLSKRRVALVFAFGLLHGLGFAGVLGELGLPAGRRLLALLSFNVGVELGQIAVLTLAFLVLGRWLKRPWYRSALARPISLAIALTGLFWTIERLGLLG